ncbi:MAG: VCBS repeat-containing protein, partial [Polyangiales bacterium]
MKAGFIGCVVAISLLHQVAFAATPTWIQSLPGAPDGASYGDVDGDGQFEIGVVVRGDPGYVVLLDHAGQVLWTHTAATSLVGFPTFGDYDGNGTDEIAYCESSVDGSCHVLNADGTVRYSFGSYYYPGMSGSGPTAADITGDGADDLLVLSWGGTVAMV